MESDEEYAEARVNAVLFYNRACYRSLKAMLPPRNDVLLGKALDDLKLAIDYDPVRREYAWEDEAFEMLKKERIPRFTEIVGREYPELTGGTLVKA